MIVYSVNQISKTSWTHLLEGHFEEVVTCDVDLHVTRQSIRLAQIPELTQFPAEAALVLDGNTICTFRPIE